MMTAQILIAKKGYTWLERAWIKARYKYSCVKCGATEHIQAHAPNGDHTDWRNGIVLCVNCHADEHPDVPRRFITSFKPQSRWPNISVAGLARQLNCCRGTIVKKAKHLNIPINRPISDEDIRRIRLSCRGLNVKNSGISEELCDFLLEVRTVDREHSKSILIWMPEEERDSFKAEAKELGISVADFVRLMFKQFKDGIVFKKDKEKKNAS